MVSSPSIRTKVFISYSHADKDWLERLKRHLKPLVREGRLDYWDDTHIRPGDDWRQEIRTALDTAQAAVLLISADFFASDFIDENELPPLLAAGQAMGAIFDELGRAMLILGAPGAGKTTLLLELARDLLDRAERDAAHPIPVVFHLSSWAARRRPLADW